jgi:hypothetical protein
MRARQGLLAAGCAVLALAGTAVASDLYSEKQRFVWQEHLRKSLVEVEEARAREDLAVEHVAKLRHRRKPRGEARQALLTELDAARAARAVAEQELEDFYEVARRAGVPPGWLRLPEDEDDYEEEPTDEVDS